MMHYSVARGVNCCFYVLFIQFKQFLYRWVFICINHFVIRNFKYFCEVDFNGIVHRIFHSRNTHPMAPCGNTLSCQFKGISALHKSLSQGCVGGIPRPALLVFEQIRNGLFEKLLIKVVVHPYCQIARNIDFVGCVKTKI